MLWIVVEDISGSEPRLDAVPFNLETALILLQSCNIRCLWRIAEDTREDAIASVAERLNVEPSPDCCTADDLHALERRIEAIKQQMIVSAVEKSGGNIAKAARSIGINRKTIYYNTRWADRRESLQAADVGS